MFTIGVALVIAACVLAPFVAPFLGWLHEQHRRRHYIELRPRIGLERNRK